MAENNQDKALAIICIFPVITTLFVWLRVWSRYLGRNFGWDDGLIVVAWVLIVTEAIVVYKYTILTYAGYPFADVPKQTLEEKLAGQKYNFANQLLYHPLMTIIRASIVLFLFRLEDYRRIVRVSLHTVWWLNIGYMISTFIANVLQCSPVSYSYDFPARDRVLSDGQIVKGGTCFKQFEFVMASCALSIFFDLIIMPIPTVMVWNLQMPRRTKIAVVIVMSLGWIATALSVIRLLIYRHRFALPRELRSPNIGYTTSVAEINVAATAACAPALKRLFRHLAPRLFPSADTDFPSRPSRRRESYFSCSGPHTRAASLGGADDAVVEGPYEFLAGGRAAHRRSPTTAATSEIYPPGTALAFPPPAAAPPQPVPSAASRRAKSDSQEEIVMVERAEWQKNRWYRGHVGGRNESEVGRWGGQGAGACGKEVGVGEEEEEEEADKDGDDGTSVGTWTRGSSVRTVR